MVQGNEVEVTPHSSYVLMLNYTEPTEPDVPKPDEPGTTEPDAPKPDVPESDNTNPTEPDKDNSETNKPEATRPQTGINYLASIGIGSLLIIGGSLVYYFERKKKMK